MEAAIFEFIKPNKNSLVSTPTSYNDNVKYINLDERQVVENFESGNISKWSKTISQMKNKGTRTK